MTGLVVTLANPIMFPHVDTFKTRAPFAHLARGIILTNWEQDMILRIFSRKNSRPNWTCGVFLVFSLRCMFFAVLARFLVLLAVYQVLL